MLGPFRGRCPQGEIGGRASGIQGVRIAGVLPGIQGGQSLRLNESDSSLSRTRRQVEEQLRPVACLGDVSLAVVLLPSFRELGPPVSSADPTAYKRREDKILVNAILFPSLPLEIQEFAFAHEIGHHTHDAGITTLAPGFRTIHSCLIADWLAAQWGFEKGMRRERLAKRGEEYCDKLSIVNTDDEFLAWVVDWHRRFTIAEILGQQMAPPSHS